MWKKGHVRRNWTERWFVLKPSSIEYFVSEDLKDKRGEVKLDKDCVVEVGKGMDGTVFVATERELRWIDLPASCFCVRLFQTGMENAACSASKPTTKPLRSARQTRSRRWSGFKVAFKATGKEYYCSCTQSGRSLSSSCGGVLQLVRQ